MKSDTFLGALLSSAVLSTALPASAPVPANAFSAAAPDKVCNNAGLEWAYYTDNYKTDNPEEDAAYDPTVLKKEKPVEQGATTYLLYDLQAETIGPSVPVYNDPTPQPSSYFALNHRGYIYAAETGNYVFTNTATDDLSYLWVGTKAYKGWDKSNSDLNETYVPGLGPGSGRYIAPLVKGNFYPLRIVYKQGAGNADFEYTITDPKGKVLISSDPSIKVSPYVLQYSCDGFVAPKFPAFGKES